MATQHRSRSGFRQFIQRERSGSIAIEFAALAPLLLLLIFGTLRIGHAIGVQHALSQLAASAARQALPSGNAEDREGAVRTFIRDSAGSFALLDPSRIDLAVNETSSSLVVRVSMDVSHIPDIPIVSAAFRFPAQQSASAVIAVQH
ncbi:TadE/TadG family type IV pilus assembly protein [Aureimonas phyllosphaerae]|uniref:TadE/TadG family type IV pilus assembly protein n=1 Tax=Aureimonas phyllosphaerae TaxID=1166078 RepID=UPI003A5BB409